MKEENDTLEEIFGKPVIRTAMNQRNVSYASTETKWREYEVCWCGLCECLMIRCSVCHNSSCNGSACKFCNKDFVDFILALFPRSGHLGRKGETG